MAEPISPAKFARLALAHPKVLRNMLKDLLKDKVKDEEIEQFCRLYFEILRRNYPPDRVC